jgi:hypothetical protein
MNPRRVSLAVSVLALLGLASFLAVRHLPLWRDMRINSSSTADIRLPSGHIVPSNEWFSFPSEAPELGFLQVQQGDTHHNFLFQSDVSTELAAMITPDGSKPLELVRGGSSGGRTEYWVEPVSLQPSE